MPMAATNTDVPLFPRVEDKADTYLPAVLRLLRDGRWHSAHAICQAIPELDKRVLREIRHRAKGQIISSAKGYQLTTYASADDIRHYLAVCYRNMREYQQTAIHVENFAIRRKLL